MLLFLKVYRRIFRNGLNLCFATKQNESILGTYALYSTGSIQNHLWHKSCGLPWSFDFQMSLIHQRVRWLFLEASQYHLS